jgi:hypothetical protein
MVSELLTILSFSRNDKIVQPIDTERAKHMRQNKEKETIYGQIIESLECQEPNAVKNKAGSFLRYTH